MGAYKANVSFESNEYKGSALLNSLDFTFNQKNGSVNFTGNFKGSEIDRSAKNILFQAIEGAGIEPNILNKNVESLKTQNNDLMHKVDNKIYEDQQLILDLLGSTQNFNFTAPITQNAKLDGEREYVGIFELSDTNSGESLRLGFAINHPDDGQVHFRVLNPSENSKFTTADIILSPEQLPKNFVNAVQMADKSPLNVYR